MKNNKPYDELLGWKNRDINVKPIIFAFITTITTLAFAWLITTISYFILCAFLVSSGGGGGALGYFLIIVILVSIVIHITALTSLMLLNINNIVVELLLLFVLVTIVVYQQHDLYFTHLNNKQIIMFYSPTMFSHLLYKKCIKQVFKALYDKIKKTKRESVNNA